jgi:hypothetical protein
LQNKGLTPEEGNSFKAVMAALTSYQKDASETIDLVSSDVNYATIFMEKVEEEFQTLYKNLNELPELETKLGQVTYDGFLASFNASLKIFIAAPDA